MADLQWITGIILISTGAALAIKGRAWFRHLATLASGIFAYFFVYFNLVAAGVSDDIVN